jgi:hypothetical protein
MASGDEMLYIGGSKEAFRCTCGANVFHRIPDEDDDELIFYECNGCHKWYETDKPKGDCDDQILSTN